MKVIPFWNAIKKKKAKIALDESDPRQWLGKSCLASDTVNGELEEVQIKSIVGSMVYPKHFEINGTHLVPVLSFYIQMMENRLPTEEEAEEFELATQINQKYS